MLKPVLGSQIQLGHPLARGLVGCWLMNEGSGDKVCDLSGNGNTGIARTGNISHCAGKYGTCVYPYPHYFVVADNDGLDGSAQMSWVWAVKIKNHATRGWASKYVATVGNRSWDLSQGISGALSFRVSPDGASNEYRTFTKGLLNENVWYRLAIVFDYGNTSLYVNGVWQETLIYTAKYINAGGADMTLIRGYSGVPDAYFSDMNIYKDRALSAQEVRQLYMTPFCMFEEEPIELWSAAGGVAVKVYSRGDVAAMPADDTDLENEFTSGEYTQVETDNADRVAQTATGEYAAFLFKNKHTGQATIDVTWNGQSDLAPSESTIYLQIYNRITPGWETLDSDNATAADTDFDLEGQVTVDLANYFDVDNWIACRVYQEAI